MQIELTIPIEVSKDEKRCLWSCPFLSQGSDSRPVCRLTKEILSYRTKFSKHASEVNRRQIRVFRSKKCLRYGQVVYIG